jgi:hypothetical protein
MDTFFATKFLSMPQYATNIRSLDLTLIMSASLTDFYLRPETDKAIIVGSRSNVTYRNNPWETLCRTLANMPHLRRLRIWIDTQDLRPWHKRAAETRLFASLFTIRQCSDFVLCLPRLPEDETAKTLENTYLEGDKLDDAPFRLERADRANSWHVYLSDRQNHLSRRPMAQEVPIIHARDRLTYNS